MIKYRLIKSAVYLGIFIFMLLGCNEKYNATSSVNETPKQPVTSTADEITSAQPITGIDVSKWQGAVDFKNIAASGHTYVFVKVSLGDTDADPDYITNINNARAAGLAVGSYHFFMTDDTAEAQFTNFSQHASIKTGDLPPVVDIEVLSKNTLPDINKNLLSFLTLIETRYGVKPILYSGESFANEYLTSFDNYPLWLAEYTNNTNPALPKGWSRWTFWQYTQDGTIAGITGKVDLDKFNGNSAQFNALLID